MQAPTLQAAVAALREMQGLKRKFVNAFSVLDNVLDDDQQDVITSPACSRSQQPAEQQRQMKTQNLSLEDLQ